MRRLNFILAYTWSRSTRSNLSLLIRGLDLGPNFWPDKNRIEHGPNFWMRNSTRPEFYTQKLDSGQAQTKKSSLMVKSDQIQAEKYQFFYSTWLDKWCMFLVGPKLRPRPPSLGLDSSAAHELPLARADPEAGPNLAICSGTLSTWSPLGWRGSGVSGGCSVLF